MIQISMWYVELMKKKKKVNNVMWCDFLCDMTIDPLSYIKELNLLEMLLINVL